MHANVATIVVTDDGTDTVTIKCIFGEDADDASGASDDSAAHRTAMRMLALIASDDQGEAS